MFLAAIAESICTSHRDLHNGVLPLKTLVAHLACISEMGIMAPRGCTRPIMARVWRSNSGGKTYLYKDPLLSDTAITCGARKGKENL